jgi:small subunit ribosomal protein S21
MGWKTGGNALIQNELNNSITNLKPKQTNMIIVPVKEGENIERALKKFKRKYEKTGVVKELRRRQQYNKPSVLKRLKMEHAIYVQQLRQNEEI